MSIEDIRRSTKAITEDPVCGLEVFFAIKDASGQYSIKKADFTADAQSELKDLFKQEINLKISDNDTLSLMKITASDNRSDVIFEYDIPTADQAIEIKLMNQLASSTNFSNFSFTNDGVDNIKAILMIVGTASNNMIIYKHVYPINLFDKKGIFFVKDRIESVDSSMIRISGGFDFFMLNNVYYVINIKLLERKYGFDNFLKKTATAIVQSIKSINLVQDITSFEARIGEKTFARKLARVSSQSLILSRAVPASNIISFIESHPVLKTKFRCDTVNKKIILDTKVSHDLFIELLRDAYLRSELTNENYHAIAKDSL
ncbi:anti-phage protein KwaB [Acinetobacter bereziniae]|uniref:anti-phage protein KwaB n=1 Tax=Acinetobacter bereziniae TaxID=106648 RepID=UPI0012500DA0|nr:anti-phage protein KwaB [Acinetobacter bereziniae]